MDKDCFGGAMHRVASNGQVILHRALLLRRAVAVQGPGPDTKTPHGTINGISGWQAHLYSQQSPLSQDKKFIQLNGDPRLIVSEAHIHRIPDMNERDEKESWTLRHNTTSYHFSASAH